MLLPTDPDVQEALDSIGKQVVNSLQTRFNLKAIIAVANSTWAVLKIGPEKNSALDGIWTHDPCNTGAALNQLS